MKVNICGVEIAQYTFDEIVEALTHQTLSGKTPEYVVTPNLMDSIF
jgi:N-acetylglucosaminyldiphosphoundecaprenol N-acetyl-beta-D-mannosaminyltransferase